MSDWESLQPDLHGMVSGLLEFHDKLTCELVCKRWLASLTDTARPDVWGTTLHLQFNASWSFLASKDFVRVTSRGLRIEFAPSTTTTYFDGWVKWLGKRCHGVRTVFVDGMHADTAVTEAGALFKLLSMFRSQHRPELAITQRSGVGLSATESGMVLPSLFNALWSKHITELDVSGVFEDFEQIVSLSNLQLLKFASKAKLCESSTLLDGVTKLSQLTKLVFRTLSHTPPQFSKVVNLCSLHVDAMCVIESGGNQHDFTDYSQLTELVINMDAPFRYPFLPEPPEQYGCLKLPAGNDVRLQCLKLGGNRRHKLDLLSSLLCVTELHLTTRQVNVLDRPLQLQALQKLVLSINNDQAEMPLPKQWEACVNLQELHLLACRQVKNKFDLPTGFLRLRSLTKLRMTSAGFKALPKTLFQLSSLQRLELWDLHTPISSDLTKLASLPKLSCLDFGAIHLDSVRGVGCISRDEVYSCMNSLTQALQSRPEPSLRIYCPVEQSLKRDYGLSKFVQFGVIVDEEEYACWTYSVAKAPTFDFDTSF